MTASLVEDQSRYDVVHVTDDSMRALGYARQGLCVRRDGDVLAWADSIADAADLIDQDAGLPLCDELVPAARSYTPRMIPSSVLVDQVRDALGTDAELLDVEKVAKYVAELRDKLSAIPRARLANHLAYRVVSTISAITDTHQPAAATDADAVAWTRAVLAAARLLAPELADEA